ncbi:ATP-dependent Clp protease adapter ClpS [Arthrobacter livingstonensis]|uniref:ATP-dependent Clp protease adapter protein ClpS n=1 Tax=Arthrobacter livingstonensis TaxID=670078 RepID=A0A2V5LDR2_9MICC|nr:ATP-dependent Clp protease adapter ClpS [Arthrobacter livingstonensis]PYI68714.1 ATP-dependent Clp protease adapter ClpS [Arthrobacter livingstonensis]
MSVSTAPETDRDLSTHELASPDIPWELIVWNDPVNLMSYVSYVFQSYFGYSEAKAAELMMQVHTEGKSAVARGAKEKMEAHAVAMHGFGLWATVQKGGARG